MPAERHTLGDVRRGFDTRRDRVPASRVPDDTLLDAARKCVLHNGVRRTTLAEIARTAGVSRMTLYRRFPDVRSIIAALMTREFSGLIRTVTSQEPTSTNGRGRLVHLAVSSVRALTADPVMRTIVDVDSEMLLPYVTQRLGTAQRFAEQYIRTLLATGHEDGSIRRGNLAAQTRSVLLVVQSYMFSLQPATVDLDEQELLAELGLLLDGALKP